jgi:hypothetical protein
LAFPRHTRYPPAIPRIARRALLSLATAVAALCSPSAALAASSTTSPNDLCVNENMSVTTLSGTGPEAHNVMATVTALGASGLRISRLHLDLQVQERTATSWVRFVTTNHVLTYTNFPGTTLHRVWTLQEDADPIDALLDNHVQMRVYAKFSGVCRGESLGLPLLFGLTAPMFGPT